MRFYVLTLLIALFSFSSFTSARELPQDFVFIEGSTFRPGTGDRQNGDLVRIEDFEILDHPVTNREWKDFVDATGYPLPLHWEDGSIPEGKEEHPVIFVNRYDVDAYLEWLSNQEDRIYRLPITAEFEYAARGDVSG